MRMHVTDLTEEEADFGFQIVDGTRAVVRLVNDLVAMKMRRRAQEDQKSEYVVFDQHMEPILIVRSLSELRRRFGEPLT